MKIWLAIYQSLQNRYKIISIVMLCTFLGASYFNPLYAQSRIYLLESISIIGSERITTKQLSNQLHISPGIKLNDQLVMTVREKLLGLGLFKSVILYMKKGSKQGQAKLIIEIEDDPSVLGAWALGSEVVITSGEPRASNLNPNTPSFGYRANLLARNLLGEGYRASTGIDLDNQGIIREGQVALGLPKFAEESVQLDGQITVIDTAHRYLSVLGFGQKADVYWTKESDAASLGYGVAMYLNRERFALPGFPKTLIGPKISYAKETRLLGFSPSEGYGYGASLMLPIGKMDSLGLEVKGGKTLQLRKLLSASLEGTLLTIGAKGLASRADLKFDLPVGRSDVTSEFAKIFLLLEGGYDHYEKINLNGSAVTIGLRYHSPGFIAEVGLKLTSMPRDLKATYGSDSLEARNSWESGRD